MSIPVEKKKMREIQYLSPSGISTYLQNPSEFYLRYLAEKRPPNVPQTMPMAIGSAFDAYVKSYLHNALFGNSQDPRYELRTIFEAQVEDGMTETGQSLREWAWQRGKHVFEQYKQSGALSDLMLELESATGEPRFEFEIRGAVHGYRQGKEEQFGEVTLLGKPDVDFVTKHGVHCILDWKVNGYCAKYARSPSPYYLRMRSAGRTNHGAHAKCRPMMIDGMLVNVGCRLEDIDDTWARQLSVYAWLCGESIGSKYVTIIHQLVCNPVTGSLPSIRIAEHVNTVSPEFQQKTFDIACDIWEIAKSDHFFRDMSKEESQSRCQLLEGYTDETANLSDDPMSSFMRMMRQ
jgi:hypothetical protein